MELLNLHLDLWEKYPGKYEPLKHFFKIYINNFPGASDLRAKLMETHSIEEARAILDYSGTSNGNSPYPESR